MFSFAAFIKKMNSLEFLFIFFILLPFTIPFGRCDDVSFSVCWMSKDDALERQNGNIWLNDTALKSLRKVGKITSLTVYPAVENKLTLQYGGGSVREWTLRIPPRTRFIKIRGRQKPLERPTNATKGLLDLLSPTEVFACEKGTLFFHQDENFFLAVGHTLRHPVKLESRSSSALLVRWAENDRAGGGGGGGHGVTLYHVELDSYVALSVDSTVHNAYRFTALDSCTSYAACVEIAGTNSLTCLSALTDPDVPKDFAVTSWNSSSTSLAWDCPENRKYSFFLLTAFHLNGSDHVTEEVPLWQDEDTLAFTLSDLPPCSRVKFGLQTVCQAGAESLYSKMVLNDGNSVHSNIRALRQTSFGPDNYTLSWEVGNASSVSAFRVYHEGALRGTTLLTSYTVVGLSPCQQYHAKVEALCGDGVVMSAKTLAAHTGPHGVSELRYRSNDSTALWTPGAGRPSAVAFLYELSLENGTALRSSRVSDAALRLSGLEEGKTYVLDVWEECDGRWESERSQLCFEGVNSSLGLLMRAAGEPGEDLDLQLDFSSMGLTMVLPWSLPEDLQDDGSELRSEMDMIFKNKMQELLKDFDQPARVELASFEPADEPDKTEITFVSFDASDPDEDVPLLVEDQLDHIRSLNASNINVADGVVHWEGQDLCERVLCPPGSLCLNTLGSFTCVCRHGYYDVSPIIQPPPAAASRPICNEKGLFSQCLDKLMSGGIAKPYLTAYIGGKVEVKLNDGRCSANESDAFFHFRTSRKSSQCGTERRVNETHIEFQNTLTVTLTKEQTISRRDLKVVWKCVYPRHYVRNAQVSVGMDWLSALSLVEFNSSLQLVLTMSLYGDESFTDSYREAVALELEDTLFFQVALQTDNSFASDVLLQVDSCWATESADPQDAVRGVLLQDGCPADNTFQWLSVNGKAQESRFSVQMFTMPKGLPLYVHCLANLCEHDEDCTKNCSSQQRSRRSVSHGKGKRAAVVSAGPLLVNARAKSGGRPSRWAEHMTVISIVAGSIGFLALTVLSVRRFTAKGNRITEIL